MSTTTVAIKKLDNGRDLELPAYATAASAGVDLMAAIDTPLIIEPGARATIPTGIAIALPTGFEAQIRPRSGLAAKHGIGILNSPGTIDADYRGEIGVILVNFGDIAFTVEHGMRIAQMVMAPVSTVTWNEVDSLDESGRGDGGFGSTGNHQRNPGHGMGLEK